MGQNRHFLVDLNFLHAFGAPRAQNLEFYVLSVLLELKTSSFYVVLQWDGDQEQIIHNQRKVVMRDTITPAWEMGWHSGAGHLQREKWLLCET